MININEAVNIINANTLEPETEQINISTSLHRLLAEDVYAPFPSPRFSNSAMDGFAVSWADVAIGQNITLKIVGESQAGISFVGHFESGNAIRISTGALVPSVTDTVIPLEDTEHDQNSVKILRVKEKFQYIRFKGEEFAKGELLLQKETLLTPPKMALLASIGKNSLSVYAKPKVAVIITGTELVSPGQPLSESQIFDTNSLMLKSAIEQAGGLVAYYAQVEDSLAETVTAIMEAKETCQMIIFSGGVSVGSHDYVKTAAEKAGFKELFWKVNQRPGKPFFFARNENSLLFGLPGNPVSALMCFSYYIYPLIYQFDQRKLTNIVKNIKSVHEVNNEQDRTHLMRIKLLKNEQQEMAFMVLTRQDSYMLTTVSQADGFIVLNGQQTIQANQFADVYLFPWS